MMFVGAKFCTHCGARADRTAVEGAVPEQCPRCHVEMNAVALGSTSLQECPRCEGIWVDATALQQICADRERQAAVLGMPGPPPTSGPVTMEKVSYIPCPVCKQLMNRVNFAHCSNVVVDVCRTHGTWFDRDELRRVVEFIRAGGMEKERVRQMAELDERERQVKATQIGATWDPDTMSRRRNPQILEAGVSALANLLVRFFVK
jgi:Zn-finger nucleic acid-binding protein